MFTSTKKYLYHLFSEESILGAGVGCPCWVSRSHGDSTIGVYLHALARCGAPNIYLGAWIIGGVERPFWHSCDQSEYEKSMLWNVLQLSPVD